MATSGKGKKMRVTEMRNMILALAMVGLFLTTQVCGATDSKKEDIWSEDWPGRMRGRFELTEEKIERMMNHLVEVNPEQAEELRQLRAKDPEKFKVELRKAMREQFGKKHDGFRKDGFGRRPGPPEEGAFGPGPIKPPLGPRMRIRERHEEYLEWLEENYPEEAERLAELKEENPELYMRQVGLSLRKYGRIAEASRENPELAESLKEDMELKEQRNELLREIKTAADDERKKLVEELEEVVSARFDLIVKRKQIRYEQLLEKLEQLKQEVKESEAEVDKWKDAELKSENVKARVEELLSRTERFEWD